MKTADFPCIIDDSDGDLYEIQMNLGLRTWIATALLWLSFMPAISRAGMSAEEINVYIGYKSLAERGSAVAQFNLARCYHRGLGVEKNPEKAASWYLKAADQGLPYAQYNLGSLYLTGEGVPQDDSRAASWFRKAAEQGFADAQHNLGFLYGVGQGVTKDDVMAISWFRKAAEQGLAHSQSILGHCYSIGRFVPQDHAQAVIWLRKAADQGDVKAQNNLGLSYVRGLGVPKDEVQAYAYWKLASYSDAEALRNLGILKGKSSVDIISAGERRALEIQKEIESNMIAKKAEADKREGR
jgi:TPR repeat protein